MSKLAGLLVIAAAFAVAAPIQSSAAPRPDGRSAPASKHAKLPPPMQIFLVRSAAPGCEPNCPEWIAAQGTIRPGAVSQLKSVLQKLGKTKLPVLMDSPGGDVAESLALGRLIRSNNLDIAVSKTEILNCAADDSHCKKRRSAGIRLGNPNPHLAVCASACAFTLAGGVRRIVGKTSFVGLHEVASYKTTIRVLQKYRVTQNHIFGVPTGEKRKTLISSKKVSERTESVKTSEAEYQKIAKYFADMGVGSGINKLMRKAPHESIHVLTRAELSETNLVTDEIPADKLVEAHKRFDAPVAEQRKDAPKSTKLKPSRSNPVRSAKKR